MIYTDTLKSNTNFHLKVQNLNPIPNSFITNLLAIAVIRGARQLPQKMKLESSSNDSGNMESSHASTPKSYSLPKKRARLLCNRCSSIVTSEIQKCNDLQASVSAALWQASYFPSQSNLDDIQTRLGQLYAQRDAYTNEIVRVRKMLDMLVANRQGVNRCIDLHESLAAPIRRLPVDVLIHIFREALCFDDASPRGFTFLLYNPAVTTSLRLAKVCHLWREIIFQNPRLWTYQVYSLRNSSSVVDVTPIYQKESFPHSLDILVYSSDLYADYHSSDPDENERLCHLQRHRTEEMRWLMEKLGCDRWRRLVWDLEDFDNKIRCLQTLLCEWSALEVLEIHPSEIDLSDGSPFARAPQLRTLRLWAPNFRRAHDFANLCPWEQIEDLWIVDEDTSLVNFCSARSLRHLTLQGLRGIEILDWDLNPEILACLEEVRLLGDWVILFLHEMSLLGSMGSLTSLELSTIATSFSVWTPPEDPIVPTPCPSLQNLVIRDVLIDKNTLLSLIRALGNLKSLVIIEPRILRPPNKDYDDAPAVVKKGVITSDVLHVLRGRRLEHLEIVLAEDSSLLGRQSDVLDTIEYLHTISLKSAIIGIRGGVELQPPTLERMKELRKAGLKIWSA